MVDECHRCGANDESTWRGILEHFAPAVQIGLTATLRRSDNADTYAYFGEPVFTYSLEEGINDGFLTPFRVKQITTTLGDYIDTPDDTVVEGAAPPKPSSTASSRSSRASASGWRSCSARSIRARKPWCSAPPRSTPSLFAT